MRYWALILFAVAVTIPALFSRIAGVPLSPLLSTIIFGAGIVGAAFLLTWGAETAEMDISQGLAIAFLAFVTVLPEYSVDLYFAWQAGRDPQYAHYAVANMTGGNRLLIGLGWSLVALLFFFKSKRRALGLEARHTVELVFLGVAAIYGLNIFFKHSIAWFDAVVLISMFLTYLWITSRGTAEEPELGQPSATIATLPAKWRRTVVGLLFVFSAGVILASAQRFADGLVETGLSFGIDEFVLVQWVAPLASESPEIIVASLFALKGRPTVGISAVVSATVNQWTLLIGSIPVAYSFSLGHVAALPMDSRQAEEVLLTSAQALAGVVMISRLRISVWDGAVLFGLFVTQLFFTQPAVRYGYAFAYLGIAGFYMLFVRERRDGVRDLIPRALRELRSPALARKE